MDSTELQSKDQGDLLDIIDKLRSTGFGRYVDHPEIIVCGDQSAGKSSVLDAVSEMSFPTKDNLCTRFVTEIDPPLRYHDWCQSLNNSGPTAFGGEETHV